MKKKSEKKNGKKAKALSLKDLKKLAGGTGFHGACAPCTGIQVKSGTIEHMA